MKHPLAIGLAFLAVALDQISKYWVESSLPFQQPVPVIPTLSLFRTYNTGIAFSLLAGLPDGLLIAFTVAIMLLVITLWMRLEAHRTLAAFGFALILGGAIGNLIDRVMLGHVVDFILFQVGSWSFAVFNLADSFITVGAGLIVLDELAELRRNRSTGSIEK